MRFVFLFLSLAFIGRAIAGPKPVTVIPFVLEKNCIYIYCKVNDTDSVRFLFDTGANGSVINSSSPKVNLKIDGKSLNVGSNGDNVVEKSSGNTVSFGNIARQEVMLTVIPFGTDLFDGVFGTDLMKGNVLEIDYTRRQLKFYSENEKGLDLEGYEKTKLHLIDDYPAVQCSFTADGIKYKGFFGLDSGADDALTISSPFARKNKLFTKMEQIGLATLQGSDGSVYEMPIMLCPSMTFGGKTLYNIPAGLSGATEGIDASEKMAGFFGNSFLKRFNTVIDFSNGQIYFKLNNNLYSEF